MKNFKFIAPIAFALMLSVYSIGCGSASSSGGGGSTSSNGGKLSDPYIVGATMLCDVNNNGTYDPAITGEMITTTEGGSTYLPNGAPGSFTFPAAMPLGATIEMITSGDHLGAAYDGQFMKMTVDGSGAMNITPLTHWQTLGITEGAIADIITTAGITISANAVGMNLDPMYGLTNITTMNAAAIESIKQIKASIFAYCISRIASHEYPAGYTQANLSSDLMLTIEAAVAAAVDEGISDTLLIQINDQIDVINATIESFPGGSSYTMRHATADQVSKSAFNIAQYIIDQMLSSTPPYSWNSSWFIIPDWGQSLGVRYYFMDNYNYGNVMPSGAPTGFAGYTSAQAAINTIHIIDATGRPVTSLEVNPANTNPNGAVLGFYLDDGSDTSTTIEVWD
jgi:hypothetical protein